VCTGASGTDPSPRLSAWLVAAMLAMVAVPAAITLGTVRSSGTLKVTGSNPTPYGYTWSLLLFVVPIVVIGFWFLPAEGVEIPRRAFWRTIGVLVPLGFGLDFFFAQRFFLFVNRGATLGIGAPALGAPVPVEEYIFYFTAFLCVLLIYVWLDEFWLVAYNVSDYPGEAKKISPAPVPSDVCDRWSAPDLHSRRLQENVLAGSRRFPRLLYRARSRHFRSRDELLSDGSAMYQLARLQPDTLHYRAGKFALGGHAGRALQVVEFSGRPNDGLVYWGLGPPADRGGRGLDRGHLCHCDRV
jgi:hypothetical protein